jgi:hypothetical protein
MDSAQNANMCRFLFHRAHIDRLRHARQVPTKDQDEAKAGEKADKPDDEGSKTDNKTMTTAKQEGNKNGKRKSGAAHPLSVKKQKTSDSNTDHEK